MDKQDEKRNSIFDDLEDVLVDVKDGFVDFVREHGRMLALLAVAIYIWRRVGK